MSLLDVYIYKFIIGRISISQNYFQNKKDTSFDFHLIDLLFNNYI